MIHKVTLTYEKNEYIVSLGDSIISKEKDEEKAIIAFKQAVKNNTGSNTLTFEEMAKKVRALNIEGVEINEAYHSIVCGNMKYFYHTGKVFYTGEGKMVLLLGGFEYFYKVLSLVHTKKIESSDEMVHLCAKVIEEQAVYSLTDDEMSIASAVFSYGNILFNFNTNKMNKGTASEKSTFKAFKELVLEAL